MKDFLPESQQSRQWYQTWKILEISSDPLNPPTLEYRTYIATQPKAQPAIAISFECPNTWQNFWHDDMDWHLYVLPMHPLHLRNTMLMWSYLPHCAPSFFFLECLIFFSGLSESLKLCQSIESSLFNNILAKKKES